MHTATTTTTPKFYIVYTIITNRWNNIQRKVAHV